MAEDERPRVGVLALQGAFAEHLEALDAVGGLDAFAVRCAADLERARDGLVLPGGESTSMGLIAERLGLLAPLREYVSRPGQPIFVRPPPPRPPVRDDARNSISLSDSR